MKNTGNYRAITNGLEYYIQEEIEYWFFMAL